MKKGLTRAGIGDVGTLENFVQLAHRYGFQAVDVGANELKQLTQDKGGLDEAKAFLAENDMTIGSLGLPLEWRQSEEKFQEGLSALVETAKAAADFDCTSCCTYVLPSTDWDATEFTLAATRRLRLCAQILGAYGVRLGLEYVGPHHLRTTWKNPFLWDFERTLQWIDVIHEPNVGFLLDTLHWHTTGSVEQELLQLTPAQVVHVHINDAPNVPVAEVLDNGRLYPGEGVIDTTTFLRALDGIGYTGAVSQEILTQAPVQGSAEQLVQKSAECFRKVFTAAGLA